jgi:aconitate hydratase
MLRKGVESNRFVAIAATETNLECEILRVEGLLPLILRRHSGAEQVTRIFEGSALLRF